MHYVIQGDPTPLQRARFGKRRVWDSQKLAKVVAGIELKRQHDDQPLFSRPVRIECLFYFKIPKTRIKKLKPNSSYWFKPDIDNLLKFIFDVSNNVLITDDSIVAEVYSKKMYDSQPRTEITIIELGTNAKK